MIILKDGVAVQATPEEREHLLKNYQEAWVEETHLTRRGGNPDFKHWSAETRKNWAQAMIEIAQENGYWDKISEEDKTWVQRWL